MFWEYVSAENGVGFHNPSKSLNTLMTSMERIQNAVELAEQATNWGIAPIMAQHIKKLVPPMPKMSRKLQQDGEGRQQNP